MKIPQHWTHVMISPEVKPPKSNEEVFSMIAAYFGVTPEAIKIYDKHRPISTFRTAAASYMYLEAGMKSVPVGDLIGGRDYSTILYFVKCHRGWMSNNKAYREMYNGLEKHMKGALA